MGGGFLVGWGTTVILRGTSFGMRRREEMDFGMLVNVGDGFKPRLEQQHPPPARFRHAYWWIRRTASSWQLNFEPRRSDTQRQYGARGASKPVQPYSIRGKAVTYRGTITIVASI